MTDFPSLPPTPLHVSTYSQYGLQRLTTNLQPVSMTWPVANTAFYIPMVIPWPYPVARVWWANGTSVTSTNMDMGIYSESGARIYSTTSTVAAGASTIQYVDATDFMLYPGRYWFALADSTTTANRGGFGVTTASVPQCRSLGILQEAAALPLPADMTGIAVTNVCIPVFGVTRTASGF